jgi:pentose-5-phosphate-3-epimerase
VVKMAKDGTRTASRVGEFKLAIQRSQRGAYAHVVLEAHDNHDKLFAIDTAAVDSCWRSAVAFGVSYAHEKLTQAGHVLRTQVTVASVHTMVLDSNQMAVAFASYQAACIAFGVEPDDRVRLREDWTYEFPA